MIKIAICDDEPLALAALADKIKGYMNCKEIDFKIQGFASGEALLSYIEENASLFHAIYLDISMQKMNGIETAKAIRRLDKKTIIIFVTALKEYVFDAFDVNASNFLVKPINDSKLFSTLDKIRIESKENLGQSLVIAQSGEVAKVPFASIVYCEVLNHRLFVYESDCIHACAGKIDGLEKELNQDFFRCHRSYIINLRFVERYKEGFAYLSSMEKIPVATRRRQEFMQALLRFQRNEVR